MRVAMISTPFVSVPPLRYGGTELVVWELVEGLCQSGHHVTLFTAGPARVSRGIEVRRRFAEPLWPPEAYHEQEHAAWSVAEVARGRFDVVHSHVAASLPLARFLRVPLIYTLHHARDELLTAFYARHVDPRRRPPMQLVAISARQRQLVPELGGVEVVWHGLEPSRYPLGRGGDRAVFVGRLSAEKGPHLAIQAAARAGLPLDIGGDAHWKDHDYYQAEVAPRLSPDVRMLGEVDHGRKVELLSGARALLFPIAWEEPFGLIVVEAMLCGTPVLALRRGAAPELIEEGVTGWLCDSEREMATRLAALDGTFDRARCRAAAVARFPRRRMVDDYLTLYRRLAGAPR